MLDIILLKKCYLKSISDVQSEDDDILWNVTIHK